MGSVLGRYTQRKTLSPALLRRRGASIHHTFLGSHEHTPWSLVSKVRAHTHVHIEAFDFLQNYS